MSDLMKSETSSSSSSLNIEQLLSEISHLNQQLEQVKQEKVELENLLETITEHSDVVTEELQQKAEQAKRQSKDQFQIIAEATPVTVIISQLASGKILYANTAASLMLNLPKEELLNRRTLEFYYEAGDREKILNIFQKHGSLKNYEVQWKKADGTNFWAVISLQLFVFNGSEALLGTVLDITKRKQADVDRIRFTQQLKEKNAQLQRLNQLKDEFLINTSNHLSTPLEGLVNTAKSMLEGMMGEVSPSQRKSLLNLTQSGYQLLNRINNIREFSKLRHGDINLELQSVNLHQIAETVLQSSRSLIDQNNLQLINSIPVKSPSVYADPVRLQQILQILVDNAIEFTPTGQIEISTSALEVEDPQHSSHIGISVYDTGNGIAEDELAEISELFKQAEHLTTRQAGTKGLGLSIIKALVELHQGKITVESTEGVSTRFTFTLPKAMLAAEATPTLKAPITSSSANFQLNQLSATPTVETTKTPKSSQPTSATVAETPQQQADTHSQLLRRLSKIPLRVILIVPFVVQVVGAVGLVGYLSFRNGQRAVNDLVNQLETSTAQRIERHTQAYLSLPQQLQRNTQVSIENGELDPNNFDALKRYFLHQLKVQDEFKYFFYGNTQGDFLGVQQKKNKTIFKLRDRTTNQQRLTYELDSQNQPAKLLEREFFDPRSRPWYTAAQAARKATWSPIYISFAQSVLRSDAVLPVYSQTGEFLGAFSIEVTLKQISDFLRNIKISPSGETFIIERSSGAIVATSTDETPFIKTELGEERLLATKSREPITQKISQLLLQQFGNFSQIREQTHSIFDINNKRYLAFVSPFENDQGLDWLIVVAVPESDFMGQINANTQTTFILCIATLVVAIIIGILTSRWVTEPLVRLNFAAKDIAKGEWDKTVDIERADEVGELAKTFNYMAGQLKKSFETLESQNNAIVRFFPHEYLKFLQKKSVVNVQLGDHVSKEMAVMFSDIRSFTTISESMTPQENFDFVNAYLRRVSPEIRNHNGMIVKYLGDGMMAIFPHSADDAVQAGITKLRRVHEYNQERANKGYPPLQVGIGIHVGHMMVGMVGEENRMQGDAFSDNVNLTARLEGLTKFYGVSMLISEQVLEKLSDPSQYQIRFLDRAIVKGRKEAIAVYEVMDGETEEVKALKFQTQSDFEQGIEYYRRRQFAEAQRYFEQVLAVNLSDKTAALYLERVNQLMERGAPENWNGVWAFSEK
ncbi:diguanylate cyclase [Hapalosiphon sp. MRB220]|nr:diguanylate cyclase [Hapalosiphon sp. MRB220]